MNKTLRVGRSRAPAEIEYGRDHIKLKFGFNDIIKDEVKVMQGARWNPPDKSWIVPNNQRNRFALDFMTGINVFEPYDKALMNFEPNRGRLTEGGVVFTHQCMMSAHMETRRQSIIAAEMGSGKTLAAIEALERWKSLWGNPETWYCAPKVPLMSSKLDFAKWKAGYYPIFYTYQDLTRLLTNWTAGQKPPRILIADESSRLKSPDAKMSQAALHLTTAMREYWGDDCRIILMSGSPAPKSPVDWWMQCEIARPGFLREGTPRKFLERMALIKKMQGESGIAWPKIVTFRDSELKCNVCGRLSEHEIHHSTLFDEFTRTAADAIEDNPHQFVPMVNEVEKLYKRLNGLVLVVLKKDCLDLPEMMFRRVKLKPSKYMMSLAKMTVKTAPSAAMALTLTRELSDGFQYSEKLVGSRPCEHCITKTESEDVCIYCAGKKEFKVYETVTERVDSPKDQALIEELEQLEEDGRVVIGAAFQATIDRVCDIAVKAGWQIIRRDGRGWLTTLTEKNPENLIRIFQRDIPNDDKIAIIGHPKSISMGLTLTASHTIINYSSSFDAEDRVQFLARIHRPGCRGANIVDFCHLPVDEYVLERLDKKLSMQAVTLGDIQQCMETEIGD